MENKSNGQIEALDLAKVKDVSKLGIKPNYVLIAVNEKNKSDLILPASAKKSTTTWEIIKVGSNVTNAKVGDLVVDMLMGGLEYLFKGDQKYLLCDSYNLLLTTDPDNYDASI